jgi:4-amino-4-deoxy-L-arabinose transferase-like glycosyltransferase
VFSDPPFGIDGARWRDLVVLALLAVLLYAPLIGWGLPAGTDSDRIKTFATDELLPLEPLAEMHSTFVVSKPDRNYAYPWWHYFVLASAQAPYLAWLKVSGGMSAPAPDYPFGLADPPAALAMLTLIGRFVSVLMGAVVVAAVYLLGCLLRCRLTGFVAGALTLLGYLTVYYSRTGNLDVPVACWTTIGVVIFAKILKHGLTARRAAWLGVFAALALATKDQAVVVFLPLGLALLAPALNRPPGEPWRIRPLVVGLLVSLGVYAVATGMPVDPDRHLTHVHKVLFEIDTMSTAHFYHDAWPRSVAGFAGLAGDYVGALSDTLALPVLVVALAGVVMAARSRPRWLVLLLPALTLFLMLYVPAGLVVKRYMLPLNLVLDAFAALALVRWRRAVPALGWAALLVLTLGWRGAVAADLTWAQHRETRYAAAEWFAANARPGDRVEHFGPSTKLPRLGPGVEVRRVGGREEWKGDFDAAALRHALQGADAPEFVVVIPDWTSPPGLQHSGDCPAEVFAALEDGSLGYRRAAWFPTRRLLPAPLRRPPLDNPSVGPPVRVYARDLVIAR